MWTLTENLILLENTDIQMDKSLFVFSIPL